MLDNEKQEQEAYERGYDIEELMLQTQSGKRTFRELEEERDELDEQNQKLYGKKQFWMVLTLVAATIVCVLGVVLWITIRNKNSGGGESGNSSDNPAKSFRVVEKVDEKIAAYNASNSKYKASLTKVMGKEYVAFSYGESGTPEFSLLYRNEYDSKEDAAKGEYSCWMTTSQMIDFQVPYSLADDWNVLTPEPTVMGGTKYVLFVREQPDVPMSVVVLEPGMMNVGREQDVFDAVRNWVGLSIGNHADPTAPDADKTVVLTTGHGMQYTFSASDEVREKIVNLGKNVLQCGQQFSCEITEDGFQLSSPLYAKEGEYYGEITCTILPNQGRLRVTDATVGAYVSFNYNDMDFNGVNTPSSYYIENPVVLGNGNGEKLYLPEYRRVAKHSYLFDKDHYWKDETGFRYYADDNGKIVSRMGIDVSEHDGTIDWKKVKDAGITFAFIRVGYRGPGEGTLETDKTAAANLKGAIENGLDVGVYFCTQAITEAEGIAEAEFCLDFIKGYDVNWPIVFDTEKWDPDNYPKLANGPRGNSISREQRTAVTKAFVNRIKEAGYTPMVYASTNWSIMNVNRDEFADVPFWFASYSDKVTYRYDFQIWQYTSEGKVNGVPKKCDMNILLKPWWTEEAGNGGDADNGGNGGNADDGGNTADGGNAGNRGN